MLRTIRLTTAFICFTLVTLLFLDFTGTLHTWFGWLAKIQFLPAVLALNLGVVLLLIALTWIFGRVYCSVICPLGIFQDVVSWLAGKRKKNRFRYSPALSWLRYGVMVIFILAMISGLGAWAALIAPYSAYGRIASNLFAPLWQWGEQLSGLLGGTGGQLCFLRDGSLATEPPNLYHCHSYLHYTDHTCLAEWANLLQHDLPGRNVFGIDLPFFRFQAGYRYVQMQWLRFVYPQL